MQSVLNPKYFEDCVSSVYVLVKKVSIVSGYFFIFLQWVVKDFTTVEKLCMEICCTHKFEIKFDNFGENKIGQINLTKKLD